MAYPRECSMCIWEECVFCYCWGEYTSVRLVGIKCCSSLLFPYWSSVWLFYPLLKLCNINTSNFYYRTCYFSLNSVQFSFIYIFHVYFVRCIYVYNCYFLLEWAFYQYIKSLSLVCFFDLKFVLSLNNIVTSIHFLLLFLFILLEIHEVSLTCGTISLLSSGRLSAIFLHILPLFHYLFSFYVSISFLL